MPNKTKQRTLDVQDLRIDYVLIILGAGAALAALAYLLFA
jgi:hypothetical protein